MRSTFRLRLRRSRQARELARILIALDRAAADVRPLPAASRPRLSFDK